MQEEAAEEWIKNGCQPEVQHNKLQYYAGRRKIVLLKLSMISAMSKGSMTVELEDFSRAKTWLLAAEAVMPDIFKDMAGRSDTQVIQALHFFAWQIWATTKKPVPQTRVYEFMQRQVPSEKIKHVLDAAHKANIITILDSGDVIPKPKNEHGIESI